MRYVVLVAFLLVASGCLGISGADGEPLDADPNEKSAKKPFESQGPYDILEIKAPLGNGTTPDLNVTWRIFEGTGNCCENYLLTSPEGWILDFGGTYIQYTRDEGVTWETVPTDIPYSTGEGAIANAPGGDIVGVGWSPYSGDQAWAHHYDNETDAWSYMPMPMHWPFWDREWIVAIPGPFTLLDEEADWISIARGGWPYKDTLLVSGDGLTYTTLSVPAAESVLDSVSLPALDAEPDPERDWLQPATHTTIIDIGGGRALKQGGECPAVLGADLKWRCLVLTEATLAPGRLLMDSTGGLHAMMVQGEEITYSFSHDGGRSWGEVRATLPEGKSSIDWDYKAHAALDQTVLAIHASTGDGDAVEFLYRWSNLTGVPELQEVLQASTGGGTTDSGIAAEGARYDFMTTALLPDGRAILSVSGMDLSGPALAVEIRGR